jgi:hypothetical protein
MRFVKGFPCGSIPPHPINIKGHDRLRFIIQSIKTIYLYLPRIYFYLFPTFPVYYLLFFLRPRDV